MTEESLLLPIPMEHVGPIKIISDEVADLVKVPLATYESPLWPSTHRGALVSRKAGGIHAVVIDEKMTRSIAVQAPSAIRATKIVAEIEKDVSLEKIIAGTSRFARLKEWQTQIVGNLIYLRLSVDSGEASGHNMVTKAADAVLHALLEHFSDLRHISVSGNYCVDKKVSAVNGILGRGKYVCAEIFVPASLCQRMLHTTPQKIVDLHVKKNLMGSILAGSVRSANAHFANMLLAFYLATGQDAANIVEGSQGIVHAEVQEDGGLYFSVTLPNIIVGTVGNGKNLPAITENLELIGCLPGADATGQYSRRLAIIAACTVLCGELSLLAAQTNMGELIGSHERYERAQKLD